MKKRTFLKTLGLATLGLGTGRRAFGQDGTPGPPRRPHRERPTRNGIWITKDTDHTPDEWRRLFDRMRIAGIDGILPQIYDGKEAYWDSQVLPVKTDRLGMLLPLAKEAGLEVHAWMFTLPCRLPEVLAKHPDWYTVNRKGDSAATKPAYVDYYKFLEPAHPGVRELMKNIVADLSMVSGLAGVHLDYIRYPDAILPKGLWAKYGVVQDRVLPEFDYGYSEYNRSLFKASHGVDPIEIKDADVEKAWLQYRLDAVTDLVNDHLVPAAHAREKAITAAVFPGPTLAREMVRQDWSRWKLNAFFPMLYHNFYEADFAWIEAQAREAASAVTVPVCAGLFAPALEFDGMARSVRAALDGGASGVSAFSLDSMTEQKWMGMQVVLVGQRPD